MKEIVTNDGKKGGWLKGKPHYDKDGKPLGGIKAVVTDAGGKPVELEGGEVIINKEASAKHWKELSRINQSAGNGVAIGPPSGDYDEDPEEYKEGGKVIEFNANHVPNKWILNYAKNIKEKHPEIWKLGGNIFGNQAFINLKRVSERGYWLDSEKWMYIKWRSYVARHKKDFRIEGVVAMLKWVDKVDKGWAYMKDLIEERIDKIKDKKEGKGWKHKMKNGGGVNDRKGNIKFMEWYVVWYKKISDKINITFSLPHKLSPFKEKNVVILDLFETTDQNIDAKPYLEKIVNKADEYGVTIYLEPMPRYKFSYYQKFGFELTADKNFMKRLPKSNTNEIGSEVMKSGGKTIAQTPAPKKERIYGSKVNKPESAESESKAKSIKLSDTVIESIKNKIKGTGISLATAKAVVRRGMGAYSSSHRPTITGGKPNSRVAWGLARLNAFLYKAEYGKSKSGKYTQDDDLLRESGFNVKKYHLGGDMSKHLAPNGKPSNLTHEQWHLVRTPEFKAWFGDWESDPENASKVVDENGEPLVVYHGTTNYFNIFSKSSIGKNDYGYFGQGFYFGDINAAEAYSQTSIWNQIHNNVNPNGRVLSCFLNIRNPLIDSSENLMQSKNTSTDFTKSIIKNYDGIISIPYQRFSPNTEYVAFESTQIKLADGTNTTFDGRNPDIRYADGGLIAPNGKPSNLTPEQHRLVRTPEFKAWFGDWENSPETASKVVDENGEPLVVYHGGRKFEKFNKGTGIDKGIYFSSNKFFAQDVFAVQVELYERDKLNDYNDVPEDMLDSGEWDEKYLKYSKVYKVFLNIRTPQIFDSINAKSIPFSYQDGYDGLIAKHTDDFGYGADQIVVFEPNQIKLADGTNTTFDGSNPDIRYADGGLIAPNGKQSNLTPEQYKLVRTPEFKAWFGDWENSPKTSSKVVDKKGNPLMVYHGTTKKFNTFNLKEIGQGTGNLGHYGYGFYFSNDVREAKGYGDNILNCYLNIRKPFTGTEKEFDLLKKEGFGGIDDKVALNIDFQDLHKKIKSLDSSAYKFMEIAKEKGIDNVWSVYLKSNPASNDSKIDLNDLYDILTYTDLFSENNSVPSYILDELDSLGIEPKLNYGYENPQSLHWVTDLGNNSKVFTDFIKSLNYDGVIYGSEYVAFYPEQIKLADGTNTTFDGGNPDIRYADGGQTFYERTYADGTKKRFSVDEYEKNIYPYLPLGNGGNVDIAEWETKEPELFKCLLTIRELVEANAVVKDSFIDTHNNIYIIKYEDSNPYFDSIITETCKTLTECEDYLEVGEVEVTDKFVLVPLVINSDIRFRDEGEITTVNKNNYFQATKCDFKPVNYKDCIEILDQYKSWRRKKNKPKFIVSSKFGNLMVDYESERKNSFWQSRSLSYYFISEHNKFIIRISDHWSKSNYDRSKKLNCGFIRSCYWTNFGEKFTYDIPGQSYSSELIGGAANFSDFTIIDKDSLFAEGGELAKGIKTEQEHRKTLEKIASGELSVDQAIERTAKDHLKEDPNYYTKLLKMEGKMAKGGGVSETSYKLNTPTGEPTKLTYMQQVLVRTQTFKKWFGDWESAAKMFIADNKENFKKHYKGVSKVLDMTTLEPRVVFHGTRSEEEFFMFDVSKEKGIGRPYAYFAHNIEYSRNFTQFSQRGHQRSRGFLYQCFLNIKNPFMAMGQQYEMKNRKAESWKDIITGTIAWDKYGAVTKDPKTENLELAVDAQISLYLNKVAQSYDVPFWNFMARDISSDFKYFLVSYGYDGIFYTEEIATDFDPTNPAQYTKAVTVFNPSDIKLADGRNLNFNPMEADIRMEEGGEVEQTPASATNKKEQLGNLLFGDKYASGGSVDGIDKIITQAPKQELSKERKFVDELIKKMKNGI